MFGYRNYATDENSRNNWFVAIFSGGEGWHNNHHHDPASASVQHRWWEIDISYYTILTWQRMGLASKVVPPRHVRLDERASA
jgi:stearoyl-CoA desaturase (delta-9 desaturase)